MMVVVRVRRDMLRPNGSEPTPGRSTPECGNPRAHFPRGRRKNVYKKSLDPNRGICYTRRHWVVPGRDELLCRLSKKAASSGKRPSRKPPVGGGEDWAPTEW